MGLGLLALSGALLFGACQFRACQSDTPDTAGGISPCGGSVLPEIQDWSEHSCRSLGADRCIELPGTDEPLFASRDSRGWRTHPATTDPATTDPVETAAQVPASDKNRGPAGVVRILAAGDESTFGVVVPDNETWPAFLERGLSAEDLPVRVTNVSCPGWNLPEVVRAARAEARQQRPDFLVLAVTRDDVYGADTNTPGSAWEAAEELLSTLQAEFRRSGTKLILLPLFDPRIYRVMEGEDAPAPRDHLLDRRHLTGIGRRHGIPVVAAEHSRARDAQRAILDERGNEAVAVDVLGTLIETYRRELKKFLLAPDPYSDK